MFACTHEIKNNKLCLLLTLVCGVQNTLLQITKSKSLCSKLVRAFGNIIPANISTYIDRIASRTAKVVSSEIKVTIFAGGYIYIVVEFISGFSMHQVSP